MQTSEILSALINRVALRSRLLRLTPMDMLRRRASSARRRAFEPPPQIGQISVSATEGLHQRGVHVLPDIASLCTAAGPLIEDLVRRGPAGWDWGGSDDLLESDDILAQNPAIYALGLDPSLLDFAENYVGEPCFYMGCSLKRERVSPSLAGTRQWHYDIEDDRMMRIIVYLNDVEGDGGPFEYIDSARSQIASDRLRYRSGYVGDAVMQSVVPAVDWTSVSGAAGSMIAFDGTRVFHRVSRPVSADRFSLSLTYSSRHPRQILRQVRLCSASRRRVVASLTDRQSACIPQARYN